MNLAFTAGRLHKKGRKPEWVLRSRYSFSKGEILGAFMDLLSTTDIDKHALTLPGFIPV